jgi:hypothetical protein
MYLGGEINGFTFYLFLATMRHKRTSKLIIYNFLSGDTRV